MRKSTLLQSVSSGIRSYGQSIILTAIFATAVWYLGPMLLHDLMDPEMREIVELREEAGERAIAGYEAASQRSEHASQLADEGWGDEVADDAWGDDARKQPPANGLRETP